MTDDKEWEIVDTLLKRANKGEPLPPLCITEFYHYHAIFVPTHYIEMNKDSSPFVTCLYRACNPIPWDFNKPNDPFSDWVTKLGYKDYNDLPIREWSQKIVQWLCDTPEWPDFLHFSPSQWITHWIQVIPGMVKAHFGWDEQMFLNRTSDQEWLVSQGCANEPKKVLTDEEKLYHYWSLKKNRDEMWTALQPFGITPENCWRLYVVYVGYHKAPSQTHYVLKMKPVEGCGLSETNPYPAYYFSDSEDEQEYLCTRKPDNLPPSLDHFREKLKDKFPLLRLEYCSDPEF